MTGEEAISRIQRALSVPNRLQGLVLIDEESANMAIEALSVALSREDIIGYIDRVHNSGLGRNKALEHIRKYVERTESADAVSRYAEWLEEIIVDNEGANEWLCEDTPDLEWCEKNCNYSSIQAECLRYLYEVSKGERNEKRKSGADPERSDREL